MIRRFGWPGPRLAALGFGVGVLAAGGQAPLGFWWMTLAALAGAFHLVATAPTRGVAAWIFWLTGAGYFAASLTWIVEPFLIDPEVYGWMAPFAVVLMAFGLALFWLVAALVARTLGPVGPDPRHALGLAVTLSLAELARGWVLTGFPWALPGHVWVGTPVAQLAAYVGPNGLTFLALLLAALPVFLRVRGLAASLAVLALVWGFGVWRLALPDPAGDTPLIRLVQPNAEQHLKWDPQRAGFYLDRALALTAEPGRPALVVWPETAVPYLLDSAEPLLAEIAAAGQGATVVTGIQRREGTRGWNSLIVIDPAGAVTAIYDKHHLVPFGEYIPFGDLMFDLFGLRAFAAQQGAGYTAGPGPRLVDLGEGLGPALALICYEAVFPQDLRVEGRARLILQITNDAWFGSLTGPYQHLAQARLRAIEQGLPLARAANTGVSAMIDAKGRVTASLPLDTHGHLDVTLPVALPATFYARRGDLPVFMLLCLLCALIPLAARPSRS